MISSSWISTVLMTTALKRDDLVLPAFVTDEIKLFESIEEYDRDSLRSSRGTKMDTQSFGAYRMFDKEKTSMQSSLDL